MKAFAGCTALVTGASRGLGAAIARGLGHAGAHVILTARTEGALEALEAQIHAAGGSATIAPMDLMQGEHIDRLAQAVAQRWGKLDLLVLNAGYLAPLSPVGAVSVGDWDAMIGVNLSANWRLIRAFDALLRTSSAGKLAVLTSNLARAARAYWGPYAAAKAALEVLVQSYAEETRNISRVRTALINPGATRTAMRAVAYPGEDPASLPPPEMIADAILTFLASEFETGAYFDLKDIRKRMGTQI